MHKCTIAAQIVHAIVMYYVGQRSYTDLSVQQPKIKQSNLGYNVSPSTIKKDGFIVTHTPFQNV